MRNILILGITLLVSTSLFADEAYDNVLVRASQNDLSAVSIGEKAFYIKSFNVNLLNLGAKPVDLSKTCFKAYDNAGKSFKVDTIGEELSQGILKPKMMVKSFIEFTASDDSVYKAELVRLTTQCD